MTDKPYNFLSIKLPTGGGHKALFAYPVTHDPNRKTKGGLTNYSVVINGVGRKVHRTKEGYAVTIEGKRIPVSLHMNRPEEAR